MAQSEHHQNFSFREFRGVNTRDQRWAIEDDQFSWLENVLPIGKGNLSVVPAPSNSIYTLPTGVTCTRITTANLNNTEYTFMFGSDGSAYQIKSNAASALTASQSGVSGTIDGVNATFDLVGNLGQVVRALNGAPSIYKTDWQGRQLQYATARTNYAFPSAGMNWTVRGTGSVTYGQAAPDGSNNAVAISVNQVGVNDVFSTVLSLTTGTRYEPSFWIKKTTASGILILDNPQGGSHGEWLINFAALGSGFERITRNHPAVAVISEFSAFNNQSGFFFYPNVSGTTLQFTAYAFQFESGTVSGSYIPTTAATVTVTDYALTNPAHVVFAVPPLSGSSVTWDGSYYTGDATTYVQVGPATQFTPGGTYTSQWNNTTLLIIDTAKGYFSWNGTTLVNLSTTFTFTGRIDSGTLGVAGTTLTVSASNGTLAQGQIITGTGIAANTTITQVVVPGSIYTVNNSQLVASETMTATPTAPSVGSVIAVFSGRVWIANGRTISYSAPNSYTDFTTANAAGSYIMTDPSLRSNIFSMVSANNYLYIFGLTSINVISDVRVSSGVTLFSNTNISSSAGTDMIDAVVPYYRSIMFASDYGIFGLTGAVAKDESTDLDGTYPLIDMTKPITGGIAAVFDLLCLFFLFQYKDPALSTTRPLIAGFMDSNWFFITPPANSTLCCSAIANDIPYLFLTDGTHLYRMFDQTSVSVQHKIQSKLFDMGDPLIDKQALKFGLERVAPAAISSTSITIDTESGSNTYSSVGGNSMIWFNNSGAVINWINNASLPIVWLASGYLFSKITVENPGNINANGSRKYLGATITASTAGGVYSGMHFQFEPRAIW